MSLTKVSGSMLQGWQVTPEEFGCVGDGVTDDYAAMAAACTYCSETGATLWMSPKVYKNAKVEVHGTYKVFGNGATVQFLGVGQTLIAGTGTGTSAVPTPWGSDPGYLPSYPATTQYTLTVAPSKGATTLTVSDATGITAGMYLFVGGNPSGASSTDNYIPQDFEYVLVSSVAGNVVTLAEPLKSAYLTTQSGVFYGPGLAIDCSVQDLIVDYSTGAYQFVIRGGININLNNITFIGACAVGATTFAENVQLHNIMVQGTNGGGFDSGRGTVSLDYNNITVNCYGGSTNALFIEESFYKVSVNNFHAAGSIAGGSVSLTSTQRPRTFTISNSIFNPSVYGGLISPCAFGTFQGVDVSFVNTTFNGAVVTPASGPYPGITGDAMIWMSSALAGDNLSFINCTFNSANSGNLWPSAISGYGGTVRFDPMCTYSGVSEPSQIVPINETGTWTPTIYGSSSAGSTTYVAQTGNYIRVGNLVTLDFYVEWSAASGTGSIKIGGLPYAVPSTAIGIQTLWTGSVAIANALGVRAQPSTSNLLVYGSVTGTGALYGTISYIV